LLLAAAAMASTRHERRTGSGARFGGTRVVLVGACIAGLIAIAIPLVATVAVRSSQRAVLAGHYRAALGDVLTAQRIEPDAATPRLQHALVLEQLGDLTAARDAIAQAESREPTNWRIWYTASRLAAESDRPQLALADYRRARALNPTSPLFK
jgi:tetratricopeptide (TPR) repeat protein